MAVMPCPATKVTLALVSMEVGGVPAPVRPWESAMEKQEECAAAMSSSGLVLPPASSARAFQSMSKLPLLDVSRLTLPLPSMREPSQCALADWVTAMVSKSFSHELERLDSSGHRPPFHGLA